MNYLVPVRDERVIWLRVSDDDVRRLFAKYRPVYFRVYGYARREMDGVFVREQYTNEGTLGMVFLDPFNGEKWLWAISKKNRKPFKLARVN